MGSPTMSPDACSSSTIVCFAENTVLPASWAKISLPLASLITSGASETIRPSQPKIARFGRSSSRHQITSVTSPKVQIIAIPEPLSFWARWCARTGTSTPNNGVFTVLPNIGWYRSSSGCATSATQAGINSGRVVSIKIFPSGPSKPMR
ncbi:unannotated protein [freshwater metagenome]|uniref:Unannotated protein n=1 Tax=freshwater metagenome TaxID=449393 RepID=A0A6J6LST9_9ZZZZ